MIRKVKVGDKIIELDVDDKDLLNDYVMEVNELLKSMRLQGLQTGEDSKVLFNNVLQTYLSYRNKFGLYNKPDEIDSIKEELKEGLINIGLTVEKINNRYYVEKL